MNTNHTPGPWTVYDDGNQDDNSDVIMARIDDENYDVCTMCDDIPIGPRKANARLIAASPTMLAALVAFMAGQTRGERACPSNAVLDMARAAIAKATAS